MSDLAITAATAITGANTASDDLFPVVDVSATIPKGRSITRDELGTAMVATSALTTALATKLDKSGGTMTGALVNSTNGAASTPALCLTGSPFTGGTGSTTTPLMLLQPSSGVTANSGWNTNGTSLGLVTADTSQADFLAFRRSNTPLGRVNFQGRASGFEVVAVGASGFQGYTTQAGANADAGGSTRSLLLGTVATGLRMAGDYSIGWASSNAGAGDAFSSDTSLSRAGVGILGLEGSSTGGALRLRERTAPSAPPADRADIWIEDNGSGKTRLMVLFSSGAAQQLAIQP